MLPRGVVLRDFSTEIAFGALFLNNDNVLHGYFSTRLEWMRLRITEDLYTHVFRETSPVCWSLYLEMPRWCKTRIPLAQVGLTLTVVILVNEIERSAIAASMTITVYWLRLALDGSKPFLRCS